RGALGSLAPLLDTAVADVAEAATRVSAAGGSVLAVAGGVAASMRWAEAGPHQFRSRAKAEVVSVSGWAAAGGPPPSEPRSIMLPTRASSFATPLAAGFAAATSGRCHTNEYTRLRPSFRPTLE